MVKGNFGQFLNWIPKQRNEIWQKFKKVQKIARLSSYLGNKPPIKKFSDRNQNLAGKKLESLCYAKGNTGPFSGWISKT